MRDRSPIQSPARLIPIRAIPILAYADFATKISVSAIHLQKAFNASFHHVQDHLRRQKWIGFATGLPTGANSDNPTYEADATIELAGSLEEIVALWTDFRSSEGGMSDTLLRVKGHPRLLLKPLIVRFGVCHPILRNCKSQSVRIAPIHDTFTGG